MRSSKSAAIGVKHTLTSTSNLRHRSGGRVLTLVIWLEAESSLYLVTSFIGTH